MEKPVVFWKKCFGAIPRCSEEPIKPVTFSRSRFAMLQKGVKTCRFFVFLCCGRLAVPGKASRTCRFPTFSNCSAPEKLEKAVVFSNFWPAKIRRCTEKTTEPVVFWHFGFARLRKRGKTCRFWTEKMLDGQKRRRCWLQLSFAIF